jgi:hypothetical protein
MPPLIFETLVFGVQRDDPTLDTLGPEMDCQRYSTEEQAIAGHDEMVLLIEATVKDSLWEEPQHEGKEGTHDDHVGQTGGGTGPAEGGAIPEDSGGTGPGHCRFWPR